MKKLTVAVLIFALAAVLAACGSSQPAESEPSSASDVTELPNPWQDCDTLEQAGELAGFSFAVPDSIVGYPQRLIRASDSEGGEIIEVIYKTEADDSEIRLRKAPGEQDISGDYNTYEESRTLQADALQITASGNSGLLYTATWAADGYSYAITSTAGLPENELTALAAQMA